MHTYIFSGSHIYTTLYQTRRAELLAMLAGHYAEYRKQYAYRYY